MRNRQRRASSSVCGALIVIAVGVVLLLSQNGIIRFSDIWRLWPMVFVIGGALRMSQSGRNAVVVGGLMVSVGVVLELAEFHLIPYRVWDLWPVAIIVVGLLLLWRSIQPHDDDLDEHDDYVRVFAHAVPESFSIFGGGEKRVTAPDFARADVLAIFGGYKLDLRKAALKDGHARVEATSIFGGVEIVVPDTWNVIVKGVGIFGGYVDETHHPNPGDHAPELIVEGVAIFGGVGVKN